MDATHLHLMLTHFPIVGTIVGIGILAYGQFSNNNSIKKVALVTFFLMSILTIPVFLTGEGAEEAVEHLAGVSESIIEEHEELAEKAIWVMGLLGILSLFNILLIIKKSTFAKSVSLIVLIISFATVGVFVQVGNLGGQIRHTEIRANNSQLNDTTNRSHESDHHDDD
jgi:uncharacterized membrane protein